MIPAVISMGDPMQRALASAPRSGHRPGLPPRAGVGLKPAHVQAILKGAPDLGFFEIHAENYLVAGGPMHVDLTRIAERYPLSIHGVGLSIGGEDPLDTGHLGALRGLLDPDRAVPAGLITWNGSDPAQRFAVYRNNVTVSLMQALADTFPVCAASAGKPRFRDLARAFARRHPPRSPVLARYGQGFADFVAASTLAAPWPYLPDLARLELACLDTLHAADAPRLDPATLAAALGRRETLPALRFSLHPSLATLDSPFAVVSRWAAQQGDGAPRSSTPTPPSTPGSSAAGARCGSCRCPPATGASCAFCKRARLWARPPRRLPLANPAGNGARPGLRPDPLAGRPAA